MGLVSATLKPVGWRDSRGPVQRVGDWNSTGTEDWSHEWWECLSDPALCTLSEQAPSPGTEELLKTLPLQASGCAAFHGSCRPT